MCTSRLKKANHVLFFIFALLLLFYIGSSILIPITFGAFLAALVERFCSMLEKNTFFGRIPAALISTLLVFVVIGGLAWMMVYQLSIFANDLPQIRTEFQNFLKNLQQKISEASSISQRQQQDFLNQRSDLLLSTLENYLTNFLSNLLMVTLKFMLVLIYVFLFLLSRKKFKAFVLSYTKDEKEDHTATILEKSSRVIYAYLWGRLKVIILLAIMYILTFWYFGVPYAVLLTLFGAFITIIPYIGPLISGLLPIVFVIVFGRDYSEVFIFAAVIFVIQLIESYVLEPMIIGSEVNLSPLSVIIAIIIGGAVWGLAGMILFVPILGIIRIWASNSSSLKPLGILLSNKDTG